MFHTGMAYDSKAKNLIVNTPDIKIRIWLHKLKFKKIIQETALSLKSKPLKIYTDIKDFAHAIGRAKRHQRLIGV